VWNAIRWQALPQILGGGRGYIQRFKDAWIRHNKALIRAAASRYSIPPELLAGVCWIEVGGDPEIFDTIAFEVRTFVWSNPDWIDRRRTFPPARTSFGAISMQLRTSAQTLGLNPAEMSTEQLRGLARCLENDVFNIDLAARHLRQLIDHDKLQRYPPHLTFDEVRIVGTRYNRGIGLSLDEIRRNMSYGNFIVNFWSRFSGLLQ